MRRALQAEFVPGSEVHGNTAEQRGEPALGRESCEKGLRVERRPQAAENATTEIDALRRLEREAGVAGELPKQARKEPHRPERVWVGRARRIGDVLRPERLAGHDLVQPGDSSSAEDPLPRHTPPASATFRIQSWRDLVRAAERDVPRLARHDARRIVGDDGCRARPGSGPEHRRVPPIDVASGFSPTTCSGASASMPAAAAAKSFTMTSESRCNASSSPPGSKRQARFVSSRVSPRHRHGERQNHASRSVLATAEPGIKQLERSAVVIVPHLQRRFESRLRGPPCEPRVRSADVGHRPPAGSL